MKAQLTLGIEKLGLSLSEQTQAQLLTFLELLQQWNAAYNLTAIRDPQKMITHHLLDSLAIKPLLCGSRLLDVGSGAGFPGIPLAIADPTKTWVLLDSNGKKVRFLLHVKSLLKLSNVTGEQARMEQFQTESHFDTIVCRALGDMKPIMAATRHLLLPNGQWLFMKGVVSQEELPQKSVVHRLFVPGLDAERHCVSVEKE